MEQGFRYEKECLSKKERTTGIGNGKSGDNTNGFNVERARKRENQNLKLFCHAFSS